MKGTKNEGEKRKEEGRNKKITHFKDYTLSKLIFYNQVAWVKTWFYSIGFSFSIYWPKKYILFKKKKKKSSTYLGTSVPENGIFLRQSAVLKSKRGGSKHWILLYIKLRLNNCEN